MPFLGGHCTDDGSIFVGAPSGITNTTAGFITALRRRYTTLVYILIQSLVGLD